MTTEKNTSLSSSANVNLVFFGIQADQHYLTEIVVNLLHLFLLHSKKQDGYPKLVSLEIHVEGHVLGCNP